MANPLLTTLPACPEDAAFATILSVLKADVTLAASQVTVVADQDSTPTDQTDSGAMQVPAVADMPLVRLSVAGLVSSWRTESSIESQLTVSFDLWTAGLHEQDMLRLYAAVRRAIWPADTDMFAAVKARVEAIDGFIRLKPGPGEQVLTVGKAQHGLHGRTQVTFILKFRTQ